MASQPDLIDLPRAERTPLVEALMGGTEPTAPFGTYVVGHDEPGAELARGLERSVFLEVFGNTPPLLAQEYGPYEGHSAFFVVLDHRRKVAAGAMRLIAGRNKTADDIERVWAQPYAPAATAVGVPADHRLVWDVATLAVSSAYRGRAQGPVSLALYQALFCSAHLAEVGWLTAIIDGAVHRAIQRELRDLFSGFPGVEARTYLDSPESVPVWAHLASWEERIRTTDPELHETVVLGRGLELAVRPGDFARTAELLGTRVRPLVSARR